MKKGLKQCKSLLLSPYLNDSHTVFEWFFCEASPLAFNSALCLAAVFFAKEDGNFWIIYGQI